MSVRLTPDTNLVILGKVGSGKSEWTKRVLLKSLRRMKSQRIVILDAKNEYTNIPNHEVAKSPMSLNEMLYQGDNPPQVIRCPIVNPTMEMAENYLRAAWSPIGHENDPDVIYNPKFPVRVLIEDAPIYYMERGGRDPPWLKKWFVLGRAGNRCAAVTMQRTQLCPKVILTMSETICVFVISSFDAENYVRRYHGDMEANMVRSLKRYQYMIISDHLDTPLLFDPLVGRFPPRPKGVLLAGK